MATRRSLRTLCRLWIAVLIIAVLAYYFLLPHIVHIFAYPLFCDVTPCQNNSVTLYQPSFATHKQVPSCHFGRDQDYAIAVLVLSRENEFRRRESIRKTWGQKLTYRNVRVATFFLIAHEKNADSYRSELVTEISDYDDIILADMQDSYKNLTLKVLHGLTWAKRFCQGFHFLVKIDSDVFFNVFPLIDYFYDRNHFADADLEFVGGSICKNCAPRRFFLDQWAVSFFTYPYLLYPDYAHGPCYVISRKSVGKMLLAQPFVRIISNEDVYFTGIVAGMYLKTTRVDVPGFLGYNGRLDYDLEKFSTYLIASHKHNVEEIERWWTKITTFRRMHNLV